MSSPELLNTARLSQQLELNKLKPEIRTLGNTVENGANWNQINNTWNTLSNRVTSTRSVLQNLNGQNEGFKDKPGYVSTKVKLTANITETTVMVGDLKKLNDQYLKKMKIRLMFQ